MVTANGREKVGFRCILLTGRFSEVSICVNLRSSAVEMLFILIDLRSSFACQKSEPWKNRPCWSGWVDR